MHRGHDKRRDGNMNLYEKPRNRKQVLRKERKKKDKRKIKKGRKEKQRVRSAGMHQ